MKHLQHTIILAALLLVGCENPIENDEALIESFDHTAPAYVMMSHSMRAIASTSGTLVRACNLNEWLSADGKEAQLAVEDKYYPYLKVREVEENVWKIYSQYYSESYFLEEGKRLDEEGAVWQIRQSPNLLTNNTDAPYPTITRIEEGCFEVSLNNAHIQYPRTTQVGLYNYLTDWGGYLEPKVNLTLTIRTNDGAFRRGEAELLTYSITGEGTISDTRNSRYTLRFSIEEPIEMSFGTDARMAENTVGVGVLSVINLINLERVTATFTPYNAIVLDYATKEGAPVTGYYDWAGNCLTPR